MPARSPAADRLGLITLALLLLVSAAAWWGVVAQASGMPMPGGAMHAGMATGSAPLLTLRGLAAYVGAWVVMMVAMMLPSAAPAILLYGAAARGRAAHGDVIVPTWIFVLGYLVVWAVFGAGVHVAGQLLDAAITARPGLARRAPYGVALVLLAAGAYQFSALKRVCLRACQHPLTFLMRHWRSGRLGALRLGVAHGWYCAGCCWGLMAVLVAAGAMGLPWVLLIALVVAAEKLLPRGAWAARFTGGALLALGVLVVAQPRLADVLRGAGM